MKRALVLLLLMLAFAVPAYADWVLYRRVSGGWQSSGVFTDKAECENQAKELAERLATVTGCSAAPVTGPAPARAQPKRVVTEKCTREFDRILMKWVPVCTMTVD
jgi:hypothetical protein